MSSQLVHSSPGTILDNESLLPVALLASSISLASSNMLWSGPCRGVELRFPTKLVRFLQSFSDAISSYKGVLRRLNDNANKSGTYDGNSSFIGLSFGKCRC